MEESIIKIYGLRGQILFFDDDDRAFMEWTIEQLEDYIENDLRTHTKAAEIIDYRLTPHDCVVHLTLVKWTHDQVGNFLCMSYDSYFRHKYKRAGKQSAYKIIL